MRSFAVRAAPVQQAAAVQFISRHPHADRAHVCAVLAAGYAPEERSVVCAAHPPWQAARAGVPFPGRRQRDATPACNLEALTRYTGPGVAPASQDRALELSLYYGVHRSVAAVTRRLLYGVSQARSPTRRPVGSTAKQCRESCWQPAPFKVRDLTGSRTAPCRQQRYLRVSSERDQKQVAPTAAITQSAERRT